MISFTLYLSDLVARVEVADIDQTAEALSHRDVFERRLGAFSPLLLQMVLARAVDSFLVYLSELFTEIFKTKPETLRSGEQVRVADVLEHQTMDELVAFLAGRRVERLAYAGLRQVASEMQSHIGFELFRSVSALDRAVAIVEARNLVVHNRGVVNQIYVRRVGSRSALGDQLPIDAAYVFSAIEFLLDAASSIDAGAVSKFRLQADRPATLPDEVAAAIATASNPTFADLDEPLG